MGLFTKQSENSIKKEADRIFLQSFIVTIIGALVCITSLSMSTWAWFVGSVNSNNNSIVAAYCEIDVSVTPVNNSGISTASAIDENSNREVLDDGYMYQLSAGQMYSVKMVPYGSATSCYLRFRIGANEYLTRQLGVAPSKETGEATTFTITCANDTSLIVLPRWGTAKELESERTFIKGHNYVVGSDLVVVDMGIPSEAPQPVIEAGS